MPKNKHNSGVITNEVKSVAKDLSGPKVSPNKVKRTNTKGDGEDNLGKFIKNRRGL